MIRGNANGYGAVDGSWVEDSGILRNVAEDLKTPLLRIVSQLQLSSTENSDTNRETEIIAQAALKLLDSYIVSTQVYSGQQELRLEPISIQAVMYDCSQYLRDLTRLQGYESEFQIQRGVGLVMANPEALTAAITSLTYSFLYNASSSITPKKLKLVYSLNRTKKGVEAGLYGSGFAISADSLQKIRHLKGTARQLTPDFAHGSSAGIVIADRLFGAMDIVLRPSRLKRLSGLAVSLVPSQQLSLI